MYSIVLIFNNSIFHYVEARYFCEITSTSSDAHAKTVHVQCLRYNSQDTFGAIKIHSKDLSTFLLGSYVIEKILLQKKCTNLNEM